MRRIHLSLAALLALTGAMAAPVPGEPARIEKAAAAPFLRLGATGAAERVLRLPAVDAAEIESLRKTVRGTQLKKIKIGVTRTLAGAEGAVPAAQNLAWTAVPGGFAARFSVTSPGAAAMRVAIDLSAAPAEAELVFFGSAAPARLVGPERVGTIADRALAWWSPVTDGETQTAEVFIPAGRDPAAAGLNVLEASHLFVSPGESLAKILAKIGEAASCNIDARCVESPSQAYLDARASVARMSFVADGGAFLCTGTMLNDTDTTTQRPWFYSANHCFDVENPPYRTPAQKQVIANSLVTFWFYESSACGSQALSSSAVQLTGGAALIHADLNSDVLFLRLNGTPPADSYFAGWDPAYLFTDTNVLGIHHPRGDLKKVSQGAMTGFSNPTGLVPMPLTNQFIRVVWSDGTTEPGSSGSGLFTHDAAIGQYLLRGGLAGGLASCDAQSSPDYYSRFDVAFPQLAPSLVPAITPSSNLTSLWFIPAESGWGINLTQHPSNKVFGLWFTYRPDGGPRWYSMPDGAWTSSTTYFGPLYSVSGPTPTEPFLSGLVTVKIVGSVTVSVTNPNSVVWSYVVDGVEGSKTITRFAF